MQGPLISKHVSVIWQTGTRYNSLVSSAEVVKFCSLNYSTFIFKETISSILPWSGNRASWRMCMESKFFNQRQQDSGLEIPSKTFTASATTSALTSLAPISTTGTHLQLSTTIILSVLKLPNWRLEICKCFQFESTSLLNLYTYLLVGIYKEIVTRSWPRTWSSPWPSLIETSTVSSDRIRKTLPALRNAFQSLSRPEFIRRTMRLMNRWFEYMWYLVGIAFRDPPPLVSPQGKVQDLGTIG